MAKYKITFGKSVNGEKEQETLIEEFDTKEEAEKACNEYALSLVQDMVYGWVEEINGENKGEA